MSLATTLLAGAAGTATVVLAARPYWLPPARGRRPRLRAAVGDFRPLPTGDAGPASLAAALAAADGPLLAAGFVATPTLHDPWRDHAALVRVYEQPRGTDVATVTVTERPEGGAPLTVVGFTTVLIDGTRLRTGNGPRPSLAGIPPDERRVRLADERDVARLYALHVAHVRRSGGRPRRVPVGDPAAFQHAEEARAAKWMVLSGCACTDGDEMRPTWKGAYLMPWRLRFPLRHLDARRNAALGRQLAAEAGLA
jgi:hypothetical protein